MSPRNTGPETISRILDAAAECFARDGYEGTGVAQICEAAGVSKGAFYHHFPSKQSLFLALLNRWLTVLDSHLQQARSDGDDVPESLQRMAGLSHLVFQSASGQLPMFLEFWTQSAHDPQVWRATIAPYQRYRDFFQHLVQEGVEAGDFHQVDPAAAGPILVALAIGVLLQGLMDPEGADWAAVLETGIMILMRGMRGAA
jgi:AcrR family transcriptional regulator